MADRARILVVDDEPRSVELLVRTLRRLGEVRTAHSGPEGWEIAQAWPPDLIITDQRMPQMTGAELLGKVAGVAPRGARVLLTGYSDIDASIRAINEGGVHAYVSKPWQPEQLLTMARSLLERVSLEGRNEELVRQVEKRNEELEIAMSRLRAAHTRLLAGNCEEVVEPLLVLVSRDLLGSATTLAAGLAKLGEELDALPQDEVRARLAESAGEAEHLSGLCRDFLDSAGGGGSPADAPSDEGDR
jgi:adenylate cyclase